MSVEIKDSDPLFNHLRENLFWHCTSFESYRSIIAEGCIRPVSGSTNRWGNRPYACQALGAVCLFDFFSPSQAEVLDTADRWSQFIVSSPPITVIVGLSPSKLPGRLVRYPENRDTTPKDSGGPIPWVEVCHVGAIPISAFETHLLVCSVNHHCFKQARELDEGIFQKTFSEMEEEIQKIHESQQQANALLHAKLESPEFKRRMELVKRRKREFLEG